MKFYVTLYFVNITIQSISGKQKVFKCALIQSHSIQSPVHFGTKFKVLIAYFIESKQQSDSFHLFIILITEMNCCLLYQLNILFSSLR